MYLSVKMVDESPSPYGSYVELWQTAEREENSFKEKQIISVRKGTYVKSVLSKDPIIKWYTSFPSLSRRVTRATW